MPAEKKLIAISPFEMERGYKTVMYKEGDEFKIPEGWEIDTEFNEFRKINRKGGAGGMAFRVPAPIMDEKGKPRYIDSRRVILPLKEV